MADLLVEIGADVKKLSSGLNQAERDLKGFGQTANTETQKVQKSFGALNQFASGALAGIAAAFSVGAIVNFGKAVLDTTAQFQKFSAVLSNTLGSESDAQLALAQITKFASETPFAVDELTSAFVKLANQGFRPTIQELTSLGDLASSTGKSFDQLAEAVLDAQVGEFERLKEFGIRAKVSGDNVTFTFKGVETQVKKSDEAIRGYILSLGQAEGVSGAMAKISETVGGKISNLGDNVTQLKLAIGNQSEGVFATSIEWLSTFAEQATLVVKGIKEIKAEVKATNFGEAIQETRNEIDQLTESFLRINPALTQQEAIEKAVNSVTESYRALSSTQLANGNLTIGQLQETIVRIKEYGDNLIIAANKTDTLGKVSKSALQIFSEQADEANKSVFAQFETETNLFNEALKESIRLNQALNALTGQEGQTSPIQDFGNLAGENAPITEIAQIADTLNERKEEITGNLSEIINGFSQLGFQISQSLGISNDALKGFVGTLLSSTPKIISALFQQAAAKKAQALAENNANLSIATGNAVVAASKTAASLGPVGLALLPVLVGGAVALISSAFKGGGGGGVSTSGVGGGTGTSFSGGSTAGAFETERIFNLQGAFEISGDKLRYVLNQSEGFRN